MGKPKSRRLLDSELSAYEIDALKKINSLKRRIQELEDEMQQEMEKLTSSFVKPQNPQNQSHYSPKKPVQPDENETDAEYVRLT
jgi:hypothetical protein